MTTVANARRWRTVLRLAWPEAYARLLELDTEALAKRADRRGLLPAVRLNGGSDTDDPFAPAVQALMASHGVIQWEYTKRPVGSFNPGRVDVTHSATECTTDDELRAWTARGARVAVVLDLPRSIPLPEEWAGVPALDGDSTDLRFREPRGRVVLLRAKGTARAKGRARSTGFSRPLA